MTAESRPELFGVLNLNKPADVTSRDVVNVVQRLVRPAKSGHAGTLDPLATGVLLVCVGPATRLVSVLQQAPKLYRAAFRLGQRSNTDDATGEIEDVAGVQPASAADISAVLQDFCGVIEQTPPGWSAVKVSGRRAYDLARRGEDFALQPRPVRIDSISILGYEWPELRLEIRCGSGTYIRSIARDLGDRLGCGGLMTALERAAIGSFDVAHAINPETLTAETIPAQLISPLAVVEHIARYQCTTDECGILARGGSFPLDKQRLTRIRLLPDRPGDTPENNPPPVAIVSPCGTQLLALGEIRRQGRRIQPRTVFVRNQ